MVITYDEIFSRFLSKVEAYELLEMVEEQANQRMADWLVSVKSNPRVRKMFTTITLDDTEATVTCEMKNSQGDADSDKDFVTELLGTGIAWKWVEPKYLSVLNINQKYLSGKEIKFFSQAQHMNELKNMYDGLKNQLYKMIRDYGVLYNKYLTADE